MDKRSKKLGKQSSIEKSDSKSKSTRSRSPTMGVAALQQQQQQGDEQKEQLAQPQQSKRSPERRESTGILRLEIGKPRRSSGGSVEFRGERLAQVEPTSPQPSVDRLSVTFAPEERSVCSSDKGSDRSDSSTRVNLFSGSPEHQQGMERVKFSREHLPTVTDGEDDDDDYCASVSAMLRRSSTRRHNKRKGTMRRTSSPFSPDRDRDRDSGQIRRRSSVFTTSSGETAISVDDGVTQEQIFENIRLHKEVLESVKQQPWCMRKKVRLVRQAKSYVKVHEGELQERLAQSKSTRDMLARFNIFIIKFWQHTKRELANLANALIPWERRIKEIESHFGSVVASYFTFLRWLFRVNFVLAILLTAFVAIPELLTADKDIAGERKEMLPHEKIVATNLRTLWDFEGVLKYSPLFYGFYSNHDKNKSGYRLPFAYFMTGLAVYVYSFVAILRRMAENSRMSKLSEKDDECVFTWKLFTGWDYMIGNAETAHNRVSSIILSFKEALLEEREKKKDERNWKVIALRVLVNFVVLILLVTSAYAVVLVVERSAEVGSSDSWWRQNEITVVMSLITVIFPNLFELLGLLESFHPRKQLRLQLARIMVLNLLNLYTLIFALFGKVSKMTKELQTLKPLPPPTTTTAVPMMPSFNDFSFPHLMINNSTQLMDYSEIFNTTSLMETCTWTYVPVNCSSVNEGESTTPMYPAMDITTVAELITIVANITSVLFPFHVDPSRLVTINSSLFYTSTDGSTVNVSDFMDFLNTTFSGYNTTDGNLNVSSLSTDLTTYFNLSQTEFTTQLNLTSMSSMFGNSSENSSSTTMEDFTDDYGEKNGTDYISLEQRSTMKPSSASQVINNSAPILTQIFSHSFKTLHAFLDSTLSKHQGTNVNFTTEIPDYNFTYLPENVTQFEDKYNVSSTELTSLLNTLSAVVSVVTGSDRTTPIYNGNATLESLLQSLKHKSTTFQPDAFSAQNVTQPTPEMDGVCYQRVCVEVMPKPTKQPCENSTCDGFLCSGVACDNGTGTTVLMSETNCTSGICTSTMIPITDVGSMTTQLNLTTRQRLRRLCWETMFGQELVKLTVMDLVLTIASTLLVDFIRAIFVRVMNNCWCWDLEKQFPQYGDFKIAENILHLVNNQGMIWMGMFFCPGLPLVNLVKLVIVMYVRSWVVLTCNVPHEVVFRASRSNNFYFALLLTMLFLCVLPVGYAIVWVEPSWHCGPFSDYPKMYKIFTTSLQNALPQSLHKVLDYIASPGIVIPLLVLLILIIYYLLSLTSALREANNDLKIQLRHERTEERRKMFQLADKRREGADTPLSKWRKILPVLPTKSLELKEGEDKENLVNGSVKPDIARSKAELFAKLLKRKASKHSATSDEESALVDGESVEAEHRDSTLHEVKCVQPKPVQVTKETRKQERSLQATQSVKTTGDGPRKKSSASTRPSMASIDRRKSSSSSKDHESLGSAWSDIPVIKISKTDSMEKDESPQRAEPQQPSKSGSKPSSPVGSDVPVHKYDKARKRSDEPSSLQGAGEVEPKPGPSSRRNIVHALLKEARQRKEGEAGHELVQMMEMTSQDTPRRGGGVDNVALDKATTDRKQPVDHSQAQSTNPSSYVMYLVDSPEGEDSVFESQPQAMGPDNTSETSQTTKSSSSGVCYLDGQLSPTICSEFPFESFDQPLNLSSDLNTDHNMQIDQESSPCSDDLTVLGAEMHSTKSSSEKLLGFESDDDTLVMDRLTPQTPNVSSGQSTAKNSVASNSSDNISIRSSQHSPSSAQNMSCLIATSEEVSPLSSDNVSAEADIHTETVSQTTNGGNEAMVSYSAHFTLR